jgi:hypothetical protein
MSAEFEKIQAAITELKEKKQTYDNAKQICDNAIKSLEIVLAALASDNVALASSSISAPQTQLSYVQLAIRVLEEVGRPMPITVLLDRIRERRNDPTITRGAVETSLLRYLTSKGEDAAVVKPSPGTYALRHHPEPGNQAIAQTA